MTGPANFERFGSLSRYSKEKVIVTEKIDGTNAQIFIDDTSTIVQAGSRNRWITPEDDNMGFAKWVDQNKEWLKCHLGPGRHYGEWWGSGIQRGYGLQEKRLSLFNTSRWEILNDPSMPRPDGLYVVPVLSIEQHDQFNPYRILDKLDAEGSKAAPGWKTPEGIVIYCTLSKVGYKMTFEGDNHKWEKKEAVR